MSASPLLLCTRLDESALFCVGTRYFTVVEDVSVRILVTPVLMDGVVDVWARGSPGRSEQADHVSAFDLLTDFHIRTFEQVPVDRPITVSVVDREVMANTSVTFNFLYDAVGGRDDFCSSSTGDVHATVELQTTRVRIRPIAVT